MAVAWLDVGGHWGLTQYRRCELAELGYDVQEGGAGWTDDATGRLASLLDITEVAYPAIVVDRAVPDRE